MLWRYRGWKSVFVRWRPEQLALTRSRKHRMTATRRTYVGASLLAKRPGTGRRLQPPGLASERAVDADIPRCIVNRAGPGVLRVGGDIAIDHRNRPHDAFA